MGLVSTVNLLLGLQNPGKIGNIELDATVSDSHDYKNKLTNFPIETGAKITDHVIKEPDMVTIEGFVTNSPVYPLGAVPGNVIDAISSKDATKLFGPGFGVSRSEDAYTKLMILAGRNYPQQPAGGKKGVIEQTIKTINKKLKKNESDEQVVENEVQLIDIVTGLTVYTQMIAVNIRIRRTKETGQTLRFTGTFKKVVLVTNAFIEGLDEKQVSDKERTKKQAPKKKTKGVVKPKKPSESILIKGTDAMGWTSPVPQAGVGTVLR